MLAYFGTEGFMKFGFVIVVHNAQPLGNLVIGRTFIRLYEYMMIKLVIWRKYASIWCQNLN